MVYFSRTRTERALQQHILELERRKTSEGERDQVLQRFARVFRTNPSAILVQSATTLKILDVNPAFERCFGYTRDQVIGNDDRPLWVDQKERDQFFELVASEVRVDQHKTKGCRRDGSHFL